MNAILGTNTDKGNNFQANLSQPYWKTNTKNDIIYTEIINTKKLFGFDLSTVAYFNPNQAGVSESLIRQGGGQICPTKEIGYIGYIFAFYATKLDQGTLGRQRLTLIGSRTHLGPSMDPAMALKYTQHGPFYIGYILHSMQQKWDQGTRGTQRSTLIGSRTRPVPSMDPAMALQYT